VVDHLHSSIRYSSTLRIYPLGVYFDSDDAAGNADRSISMSDLARLAESLADGGDVRHRDQDVDDRLRSESLDGGGPDVLDLQSGRRRSLEDPVRCSSKTSVQRSS
jgi:hypothetical protein